MQTIDKVRDEVIRYGVDWAIRAIEIDDIVDPKLKTLWVQATAAELDYIEAKQAIETYLYEH